MLGSACTYGHSLALFLAWAPRMTVLICTHLALWSLACRTSYSYLPLGLRADDSLAQVYTVPFLEKGWECTQCIPTEFMIALDSHTAKCQPVSVAAYSAYFNNHMFSLPCAKQGGQGRRYVKPCSLPRLPCASLVISQEPLLRACSVSQDSWATCKQQQCRHEPGRCFLLHCVLRRRRNMRQCIPVGAAKLACPIRRVGVLTSVIKCSDRHQPPDRRGSLRRPR